MLNTRSTVSKCRHQNRKPCGVMLACRAQNIRRQSVADQLHPPLPDDVAPPLPRLRHPRADAQHAWVSVEREYGVALSIVHRQSIPAAFVHTAARILARTNELFALAIGMAMR
jgi:hypothetical protein